MIKEYSINTYVIFDAKKGTRFECKETLYISDRKTESHYRANHEKNEGTEKSRQMFVGLS